MKVAAAVGGRADAARAARAPRFSWPFAARAQQGDRVRRIGVLMGGVNGPVTKAYVSAFTQALPDLGWTDARNVRIDVRWGSDTDRIRAFAQELVGLRPDIILVSSTAATVALQHADDPDRDWAAPSTSRTFDFRYLSVAAGLAATDVVVKLYAGTLVGDS
jgi:hypothetical protein